MRATRARRVPLIVIEGAPAAAWWRRHLTWTIVFMAIVLAHLSEHLVQAAQVFWLGWPRGEARGLLGHYWPWLITSEWLHFGYALIMLVGLYVLAPGFDGRAWTWWAVAFGVQVWHWFEHVLLFAQAATGVTLWGATRPTSIAELLVPRVELHLFYNLVVLAPMLVAMHYYLVGGTHHRASRRSSGLVSS